MRRPAGGSARVQKLAMVLPESFRKLARASL
jgi:hypothetical protein